MRLYSVFGGIPYYNRLIDLKLSAKENIIELSCSGAGLIMTRLSDTTLALIALSVFVTNLFAIPAGNIFLLYFAESESGSDSSHFIEFEAT